jgi:hypothetical protein
MKGLVMAAKPEAPDNLAIWNSLCKTDPAHTKGFSRAGGFKGTAIKPIWIVRRLTEQFGPCGKGWGMDEPQFQIVPGDNREILVFCTVSGWYRNEGEECRVFGVGGDKAVTYIKANAQYNRPERWENDDEAFKKAFTDAVGNAFKFLGVAADVHMGAFDDSKYVEQMRSEFAAAANDEPAQVEPAAREKLEGPHTCKTNLRKAVHAIIAKVRAAHSNEEIDAIQRENIDTIKQANRDWPILLTGDPKIPEDIGLKGAVETRRLELANEEDGQVPMLIRSMRECETAQSLTNWMATNEALIETLDGADSRTFQLAYELHESAIQSMDRVTAGA